MARQRLHRKFFLLMWKNWTLQKRHPFQTVGELFVPVILALLLVLIRSLVDPKLNDEVHFTPYRPDDLNGTFLVPLPEIVPGSSRFKKLIKLISSISLDDIPIQHEWYVAWSPHCDELKGVMNVALSSLNYWGFPVTFKGASYPNSSEMYKDLVNPVLDKRRTTLAGVAFQDNVCQRGTLEHNLEMTIRFPAELRNPLNRHVLDANWHTNLLFPLYQELGPREGNKSKEGTSPGYWYQGFLGLQHAVSMALLNYLNVSKMPNILLQRFPYPSYVEDMLLPALQGFVPLIFMLGFIYNCFSTVKAITIEKEFQLKESMKIMGLPNWLHWTAWFIKAWMFQMISVLLIVILLKVPWYSETSHSIFTFTHWSLLLFFLMVYMIVSICFYFMISVFFSKANTAALVGGILWFFSYAPFMFLQPKYADLTLASKLLASLASNSAMAFGFQLIVIHEGTGKGAQWSSLFKSATPGDQLVLGHIIIMMLVVSLLYLFIALYIEALFPGEYGVPKPWNFPFKRSYWCGSLKYGETSSTSNDRITEVISNVSETEPTHLTAGIRIKNLRKEYGRKEAVKDLVLNMYEGQITVLLGHNGAGKTTTLSMLTGMITPTSGTAIVGGYDIRTEMDDVRASLGICPQHNVLFKELTVYEHLYFYGKLKGIGGKALEAEIDKYISLLQLEPKRNSQAQTLSGGMQRKLAAGIALCGGSKVVLFDEPTSGMDPAARRALWDILQQEKQGRTVLLTTHFMDEADLLGDRIAIMAAGVLQCCGSSFFLKKKYGAGYHLVVVKGPECNVDSVTGLLRRYIPDITVDQNIGSELSYLLNEEKSAIFEQMLSDLEENKDILGILSYGVSLSTMEEVFMKAGRDMEPEKRDENVTNNVNMKDNHTSVEMHNSLHNNIESIVETVGHKVHPKETRLNISVPGRLTGMALLVVQFEAMFMKKIVYAIRTWYITAIQILIPAVFLIVAILAAQSFQGSKDLPPLLLGLETYGETYTPAEVNDTSMRNLANIYINETSGKEIKSDMTTYILEKSEENLFKMRDNYIVGATFEKNTIISWYNNLPYHTPPLALNLAHNTLFKHFTNHTLQVINYPLPFTAESKIAIQATGGNMGFQMAFNIGFSMAFVAAFYVIFAVKERASKAKHLQFVSGIDVLIFWTSAYLWDLLMFILPVLGIILVFLVFQEEGFRSAAELGRIFLVLLCFGWGVLPFHYLLSYLFSIPTSGFITVAMLNILTGVAAFMTVTILENPTLDLKDSAYIIDWFFVFVPHYSLSMILRNMYNNYIYNKVCADVDKLAELACSFVKNTCCRVPENCPDGICLERFDDYFEWKTPGIGRNLTFLVLDGVILSIILLLIEFRLFDKLLYSRPKADTSKIEANENDEVMDSDVAEEKKMIQITPLNALEDNFVLVLKDVTKYYGNFLAVNQLSIGIKKGECFGLLGVNGAGKTTTFKMMTGDEKISHGEAYIDRLNLKYSMKQVHQRIGYCPQFDALLEDLTGRETLFMFCLLRGISPKDSYQVIQQLAEELLFKKHIDKKVKEYSGGNKRKLSTAVALVGDPSVIFLDEPTTGMDPSAKRHLWDVICKVRDSGKSIILTSHSMEECEALCTRLAIMVNGSFRCLGSTQHLKNKFAEGYTLIIKLKKSQISISNGAVGISRPSEQHDIPSVKTFVNSTFPGAILREEYQGFLTYYIPNPTVKWSRMFGIMENAKKQLNIEDYSLGQTSLEQVFLTFTKHQRESDAT